MSDTNLPTLLGGQWVGPAGDEWFDDIDPGDARQLIARLPRLTAPQVSEAIEHSDSNLSDWASASPIDRGRVLAGAAQLIRERVDEISGDVQQEAGKLHAEARGEVLKAADFFEYYGGFGRDPQGMVLPDERPATFTHTIAEPLGVVVVITAWNDPILTPARKLAPALISGNSVTLKPAEDTPIAALHLARALVDAGLPPSTLNVVVGFPADIAEPLFNHPAVKAVSFTGSTETAQLIRSRLSGRNLRFQAETGGKNAVVVLPDADMATAASTITSAAFAQAGQRCTATSRVIALESISDEVRDALSALASNLKVGPGSDDTSQMGPVINQTRMDAVAGVVRAGADSGDKIVIGGHRAKGNDLEHGYFLEPTVVTVASNRSRLWQEEVFGPVLSLATVPDLDAAIAGVNDSAFGLSAAIFTADLGAAMEFAKRVDTGQVAVNRPTSGWDVHLPFGGFKASGSWSKEQGQEGIDFYTKIKTVAIGYPT